MIKLNILNINSLKMLAGANNINIKTIEGIYDIEINLNGDTIYLIKGDEKYLLILNILFNKLLEAIDLGAKITPRDIVYLANLIKNKEEDKFIKLYQNKKAIVYTYNNKPIFPKTIKQIEYIELLNKKDILFSLGAAGTGKTYIAISYAVNLLKNGHINKIILTRPAVEAGESLGFLPGDLKEKVDPYLRPLYDALYDTLGIEQTEDLIAKNIIEIAPLAYMRGRTLENAFIILDEAQNATIEQIKMFLTRLGFHSKMVITGDPTQIDLRNQNQSGLSFSANLLKNINEIGVIYFSSMDVVRHPLVGKIIEAYASSKV